MIVHIDFCTQLHKSIQEEMSIKITMFTYRMFDGMNKCLNEHWRY